MTSLTEPIVNTLATVALSNGASRLRPPPRGQHIAAMRAPDGPNPPSILKLRPNSHPTAFILLLGLLSWTVPASAQFFPGPELLSSPGRPEKIVMGDVDGDGRRDILVAATATGQLGVHLSRLGGSFGFPYNINVAAPLSAIAVGDLDGNGENDVAGTDWETGELVVVMQFRNTPGVFQVSKLPGQDEPFDLRLIDLESDGYPDAVVSYEGGDEIGVYHNREGIFQLPIRHRVGDRPLDFVQWLPAVGRRFVLVESGVLSNTVGVFDENWQVVTRLNTGLPRSVSLFDWDQSEAEDLLVVDGAGFVRVFAGSNDGSFAQSASWPLPQDSGLAEAFNEVGKPPSAFVLEPTRNRISFHEKVGGTGVIQGSYFVGSNVEQFILDDSNRDGRDEILVPLPDDNRIAVFLRNAQGELQGYQALLTGTRPVRLLAQEAVSGLPSRIGVLCQEENELWIFEADAPVPRVVEQLPLQPSSLNFRWGSVNSDGIPDLVVISSESGIRIFLGQAAGGFDPPIDQAFGSDLQDVAILERGPGGAMDLAISDLDGNYVWLLDGDGTGNFTVADSLLCVRPPRTIRVRDLDLDGRTDVIVLGDRDSVHFFFSQSDDTYARLVQTVGNEPRGLTTGFFNDDAWPDVAVGNAGDGTFSVFSSLAPRFYTVTVDQELSPDGSQVLIATDITGSGIDDLVMADPTSTNLAFFIGLGDGRFSLPSRLRCSSFPLDLLATDANLDDRIDLLVLDTLGSTAVFIPRSEETVPGSDEDESLTGTRPLTGAPQLQVSAQPNPSGGQFSFRMTGASSDPGQLTIYDLRGRAIARPELRRTSPGVLEASWAGTDRRGRPVASGRYFAEWAVGGRRAVRPLTRLSH